MKPINKLILGLVSSLVWVILFCCIWLDSIVIQGSLLLILLVAVLLLIPAKRIVSELKLVIPLMFSLFAVYTVFAVFRIGNSRSYWINFGITRSSLLLSSMLGVRILFHCLTLDEIMELPFSMNWIKYLILGQLLYEEAVVSYHEILIMMDYFPSEQFRKQSPTARLRRMFSCLLALLAYLMSLAKLKGERIDEVLAHCHREVGK